MNPSDPPGPGSFSHDRRRRPRHKIHTPAYARISGDTDGFLLDLNTILDLSEDGMCIQSPSALGVDNVLSLCLELSDAAGPIYTAGKVVWSNRLGHSGILFRELSEASSQRLKRWLFLNAISGVADSRSADFAAAEPRLANSGLNNSGQNNSGLNNSKTALAPADMLVASFERSDPASVNTEVDEPAGPPDRTAVLTALSAVTREAEMLGTDINAILQLVAERAFSFARASGAAVALSNGMEIICRASTGSDAPGVGARVSTEAGLSALCVRNGELLVCDDAETDARVDREACRSLGIRSIVAVPIFQESTVVGLIEVFSREAGSFDADAKLILQYLAETVALALDRTSYSQRHSQRPPDPATFSETSELNEEEHNAPRSWFRRALLALALLTVLGAVLWVLLPHARNSVPAPVQPAASQPTKQGAISAPVVFDRQRKLAEQGDAAVQFAVGARYATGDGIDQDYAEAARWFSMAAAQGNVSAEGTLAAYYLSGTGVSKDFSKAYFWALLAQAGGDQASKYRVAILASRMTRAQLVAVQEQANQWLNDHRSISPAP